MPKDLKKNKLRVFLKTVQIRGWTPDSTRLYQLGQNGLQQIFWNYVGVQIWPASVKM